MAVLLGRLFVVTIVPDEILQHTPHRWQGGLRSKAELEHFHLLQADDARGRILFRNGQPWSGSKSPLMVIAAGSSHQVPIRLPAFVHREDDPHGAGVMGRVGKPDVWPGERVVAEQGRSGLEYTFDTELRGVRPGYIAWLKDAKDRSDGSSLFTMSAAPGENVRTTVDPAWQRMAEDTLSHANVRDGAVVVLSLPSNQVLAVASRDSGSTDAMTAVKAQIPGSVFKIVTAAAALEFHQFRVRSRFMCLGQTEIPGVKMNCWRTHGSENLAEAFAESCDVAFAQVGATLGKTTLAREVGRLHLESTGLQRIAGRSVLSESEVGHVFRGFNQDNGYLANTAIGQQDVRLSPLQAAVLAATVANRGLYRPAQLVKDLEVGGLAVHRFHMPAPSRAMSSLTASNLAAFMQLAVRSERGTAHALAETSPVPVAVKTGTAEVGAGRVNGWMVGFAPIRQPQIAFAIYVGHQDARMAHQQVFAMTRDVLAAYARFFPSRPPSTGSFRVVLS